MLAQKDERAIAGASRQHQFAPAPRRRYGPRRPKLLAMRARPTERTSVPDIFDEVSEDLRAERAQAMMKKYGGVLVAAALLVLAATGGWQGWRWYQGRETARVAAIYLDALRAADRPAGAERHAARPLLDQVAAEGAPGYRTLARLREAALKADGGDLAAALALYNQVATDSAADPLLRDLATLQWATRQVDSGEPALLEARLAPLTAADHPLRALAAETQALLAIRQSKPDAARNILKRLSQDVTAPDGVRGRANGLLAQLGGGAAP